MLTLLGNRSRFCDGLDRRAFMKIGSLGMAGVTLADLTRADNAAQAASTSHSVIMVYLSGGISHQDTVDLKPDAPAEVRGEFNPISTNVEGIQFCELLPQLSRVADRLAIVRSLVGQRNEHTSHQNVTGYPRSIALRDQRPHLGGVVAKVLGSTTHLAPAAVDLFPTMRHKPYNSSDAGVLGRKYDPLRANGDRLSVMKLEQINRTQFDDRQQLLDSLKRMRRGLDAGQFSAFDTAQQQAVDVLTSGRVVNALEVEREDPQVLERYGRGSASHLGDGAPMWNDQLVMARRLVEAGVRLVTVAYGFWDTHGNNFGWLKDRLPLFDQGISALVTDIYERGLADKVTVLVWGEFGRTPQINKDAGRDHWAPVNSAILSGGGMPTGQVIGATDKIAGEAIDRPIDYRDVLATVYHQLGIDANRLIRDRTGRPIPILPGNRKPIPELL